MWPAVTTQLWSHHALHSALSSCWDHQEPVYRSRGKRICGAGWSPTAIAAGHCTERLEFSWSFVKIWISTSGWFLLTFTPIPVSLVSCEPCLHGTEQGDGVEGERRGQVAGSRGASCPSGLWVRCLPQTAPSHCDTKIIHWKTLPWGNCKLYFFNDFNGQNCARSSHLTVYLISHLYACNLKAFSCAVL